MSEPLLGITTKDRAIDLSLDRFENLLKKNGFEIVHTFYASESHNEDDSRAVRFFEVQSFKYRFLFFIRIPNRFSVSDREGKFDGTPVYLTDVPEYKKMYLDLLSEGISSGSVVVACKEFLCHLHPKDGMSAHSFTGTTIASPKERSDHPKSEAIRVLEQELGSLYEDNLKVSREKVRFIEKGEDESPNFELYDSDGTEIRNLETIFNLSPKTVHLANGKVVEYSMKEEYSSSSDDESERETSDGSPKISSTRANPEKIRESSEIADVGEVYPCYDIDELFAGLKEAEKFEDVLLKEYDRLNDVEIRMREKKINDIDRIIDEFKIRILRSIETIREAENENRKQIGKLLKILSSCKNTTAMNSPTKEKKLIEIQESAKATLDELTIDLISKRDEINSILSDYRRRISRIFA